MHLHRGHDREREGNLQLWFEPHGAFLQLFPTPSEIKLPRDPADLAPMRSKRYAQCGCSQTARVCTPQPALPTVVRFGMSATETHLDTHSSSPEVKACASAGNNAHRICASALIIMQTGFPPHPGTPFPLATPYAQLPSLTLVSSTHSVWLSGFWRTGGLSPYTGDSQLDIPCINAPTTRRCPKVFAFLPQYDLSTNQSSRIH